MQAQVLTVLATGEALRAQIVHLDNGECFMRDKDKRVERIKTDYYLRTLQQNGSRASGLLSSP